METTIRLKISELPSVTKALTILFKKDNMVEITVTESPISSLTNKETKEETRLRIRKAIENVKKKRNLVTFTPDEFDKYSDALAAKYKK